MNEEATIIYEYLNNKLKELKNDKNSITPFKMGQITSIKNTMKFISQNFNVILQDALEKYNNSFLNNN